MRKVVGSIFIIGFRLGQRACESSYSSREEGDLFGMRDESQFAQVAMNMTPRDPRIQKG